MIDLIYEKFGITILYDTFYRNLRSMKSVKILEIPIMDSTRAEVPLQIIEKHYADLNSIFMSTKADLSISSTLKQKQL